MSGQDALLYWSKTVAEAYGVLVKNYTTSWKDGLAFCALVDHYHPGRIEFETLSADNPIDNIELAFSIAEEDGVPRLLEPEDFQINIPDRLSTMTYLSG